MLCWILFLLDANSSKTNFSKPVFAVVKEKYPTKTVGMRAASKRQITSLPIKFLVTAHIFCIIFPPQFVLAILMAGYDTCIDSA